MKFHADLGFITGAGQLTSCKQIRPYVRYAVGRKIDGSYGLAVVVPFSSSNFSWCCPDAHALIVQLSVADSTCSRCMSFDACFCIVTLEFSDQGLLD
jgi:hypothetical protein